MAEKKDTELTVNKPIITPKPTTNEPKKVNPKVESRPQVNTSTNNKKSETTTVTPQDKRPSKTPVATTGKSKK